MPWITDLVEGVNQVILTVGLEREVEVDRGFIGRVAQVLPVLWDVITYIYPHFVPTWCEGRREAAENCGGKGREHGEGVTAHDDRKSPRWCNRTSLCGL